MDQTERNARDAHEYRLSQARKRIESVHIFHPAGKKMIPVYREDPQKPGSYRETSEAKRARKVAEQE